MSEESMRKTIKCFCAEMHAWQRDCAALDVECEQGSMDYEDAEKVAMTKYREIFSRFCSDQATPRDFHYSKPPQYNPEQLEIAAVETAQDGSALVFVHMLSGLRERFVFRVVRERDSLRVIEKLAIADDGEMIEADL